MIVMPSKAFADLTAEDLGRIIAFLRSLPVADGPGPSVYLGLVGRIGLATGKFNVAPQVIIETVPPPAAKNEQAALGRYLARTSCSWARLRRSCSLGRSPAAKRENSHISP